MKVNDNNQENVFRTFNFVAAEGNLYLSCVIVCFIFLNITAMCSVHCWSFRMFSIVLRIWFRRFVSQMSQVDYKALF